MGRRGESPQLSLLPEAETTPRDRVGAPHPGVWSETFFPAPRVWCRRVHQRGQFPRRSDQEMLFQCLAGLADKNKMFALAICLVLKTFLDNARALVENSMLSLLGWSQEGCFE